MKSGPDAIPDAAGGEGGHGAAKPGWCNSQAPCKLQEAAGLPSL
jgi:hypothetical protein